MLRTTVPSIISKTFLATARFSLCSLAFVRLGFCSDLCVCSCIFWCQWSFLHGVKGESNNSMC